MTTHTEFLMREAAGEIERLRRENEILRAKVETMELLGALYHTPPFAGGMLGGGDTVYALRNHAEELEKQREVLENRTAAEHVTGNPTSLYAGGGLPSGMRNKHPDKDNYSRLGSSDVFSVSEGHRTDPEAAP